MNVESLLLGLIWVVIAIVVIGVIYWALTQLATALSAPPVVAVGIRVICVLLAVLVILYWLLGNAPIVRRAP